MGEPEHQFAAGEGALASSRFLILALVFHDLDESRSHIQGGCGLLPDRAQA